MFGGWVALLGAAFAGDECARVATNEATLELGEANAVAIHGVEGSVEVVAGSGDRVTATGTACSAATLKLVNRAGVVQLVARGGAEDLRIVVTVPATLSALTVDDHVGAVDVRGVAARVAAVSVTGPVAVQDVAGLRAAYVTGPIRAERVSGDVALDQSTGPVSVAAIGGDVLADGMSGPVTADEVGGDLAVEGAGPVQHNNVRGTVNLR